MTTNQGQSTAQQSRHVINIQAKVVAEDAGSEIKFHLEPGNDASKDYVTGPLTITIPHGPDLYKVHFHVDDENCSYNLKFDHHMPICASDGECCPTEGGIKTKQLKRPDAPTDRLMSIENYNSEAGPVGFALFFRDQQSNDPIPPFDPIMQNGGGGTPQLTFG